ncbi:hypothetical protein Pmani_021458 [Petrolisthes manimaculis]|uniref:Uncharacterized protein n=1 Tax=Petrolisthes manimaculis TaxID=1843537 RepID=A0AAE1PDT7_9EUCA|nr:hypothetical protein Pmani_021458 [Petrolisthes manimaculis]
MHLPTAPTLVQPTSVLTSQHWPPTLAQPTSVLTSQHWPPTSAPSPPTKVLTLFPLVWTLHVLESIRSVTKKCQHH